MLVRMSNRAYDSHRDNRGRRLRAMLKGDCFTKRSVLVTALVAFVAISMLPNVARAKGASCELPSTANLYAWVGRDVHVAPEYVGKP